MNLMFDAPSMVCGDITARVKSEWDMALFPKIHIKRT